MSAKILAMDRRVMAAAIDKGRAGGFYVRGGGGGCHSCWNSHSGNLKRQMRNGY